MVFCSQNAIEVSTLKFRWCVLRRPHFAGVSRCAIHDLKTIGVYECYFGLLGNQKPRMVDVTDYTIVVVRRSNSTGDVGRCPYKKSIVRSRKCYLARSRRIQLMQRLMSADLHHCEASKRARFVPYQRDRK